jgi:sugar lactone lactonase YvrE
VDEDGFVYVADPYTYRVQKLTREGGSIASWTGVKFPWQVHADRRGNVLVGGRYVSPDHFLLPCTHKLSTAGALQWINRMYSVTGIATDGDGYIYFALGDGIMKVTSDGQDVARLFRGRSFSDVAADSFGFLYGVTADSLYKITTSGDSVAIGPYGGVGVALDDTRGLYVLNADRVTRLTLGGELLGEWGGYGTEDGQFRSAGGIAVAPDGTVFVADTKNARIQELSPDGVFLGKFGNVSDEPGWLSGPVDVAVGAEGTIYLATTGDNRIQKFAADGGFLMRWGGAGQDPGQFDSPRGIAVGGSGNVYVWDTGNRRAQVFDDDGAFIRAWEPIYALGTVEPWAATSSRGKSTGIAVTADDVVYMTDVAAHRVVAFSAEGAPLGSWGGLGTGPGQFNQPRDIAIGPDGRIYVVDYGNRRIQIFQLQPS